MYAISIVFLIKTSVVMGCVLLGMTPLSFLLVLWEGKKVSHTLEELKTHEREFTEYAEEMLALGNVRRTLGLQKRALEEGTERAVHTLHWAEQYDRATSGVTMHLTWLDILYKAFMLGYGARHDALDRSEHAVRLHCGRLGLRNHHLETSRPVRGAAKSWRGTSPSECGSASGAPLRA